jgi:DNA modification methylase
VLDPFLGSGTTTKIAMQNERNSVGYEADKNLLPIIRQKISNRNDVSCDVKIVEP